MSRNPTWLDRLRIERVIWTVDLLLQDLPGRSRRAARQDLRSNLLAAAAEVGTGTALRRLGSLRRLAGGYLDAEYGERGRRPRWLRGLLWAIAVYLVLVATMLASQQSFVDGVLAVNAHANGTYGWSNAAIGVTYGEATFVQGRLRSASLNFGALPLLYLSVAFALGAGVWRARPRRPPPPQYGPDSVLRGEAPPAG
jgi:hypothetical protein